VYARRDNAGHAAANGLVSWSSPVRWSGASTGALTVTALAQARRQQLPGTVIGPTPLASLASDRELASSELTGGLGQGFWSTRAWARREGLRLHDALASAAVGPTRADQTIAATGASAGWKGRIAPRTTIEARLDGSGERFEPGVTQDAAPPPGATRVAAGAALDADWQVIDRLALAASGRVDGWDDASSDGTTKRDVRPTAHLGAEADLDPVRVAAHAGTTARPPSFVELYGDRGAFLGDPTLRPEAAWTVDAGVRTSRRTGSLRFALEVVGFATWAEDLITFVPTGAYGRAKATNIGRARIAGLEVDLRAAAGPFEVRGAYTGLATENEAACTATTGPCARPPLPGRPTSDFVGDAIAHVGPASVRVGVDAVAGVAPDLAGSIQVPARVLASAGLRVEVARGVRVALDLRNALDVRTGTYQGALCPVQEPIGDYFEYPLPGRSLLVSARFFEGEEGPPR
jgi:outer membrane receptor protein involved in Fe transport